MMHRSLTDAAALPVWYQEELDRIRNLMATLESITDPTMREAMLAVAEQHTARARILALLLEESLAQ